MPLLRQRVSAIEWESAIGTAAISRAVEMVSLPAVRPEWEVPNEAARQ